MSVPQAQDTSVVYSPEENQVYDDLFFRFAQSNGIMEKQV